MWLGSTGGIRVVIGVVVVLCTGDGVGSSGTCECTSMGPRVSYVLLFGTKVDVVGWVPAVGL